MAWGAEHLPTMIDTPRRRRRTRARRRRVDRFAPPKPRAFPYDDPTRRRRTVRRRRRADGAAVVSAGRTGGTGTIAAFVQYQQALLDQYRVVKVAGYLLYRSNSTPPVEGDTPFFTTGTLPANVPTIFSNDIWYLAVSYFNGVIDSGFYPIGDNGEPYMTIDLTDEKIIGTQAPNAPTSWHLEQRDGNVWLIGIYFKGNAPQATQWTYAWTSDGTTPPDPVYNPVDLDPYDEVYVGTQAIATVALAVLEVDLGAYADAKTIKCKLATARQDIDGASISNRISDFVQKELTVNTTGPTAPVDAHEWHGRTPETL